MSLIKLLENHNTDAKLVKLVGKVMKDDKNHKRHHKLREYLIKENYKFDDYYEEYEEFLYYGDDKNKKWYKGGNSHCSLHRTRQVPLDHPLVKEYGLDSYLNKKYNPIVGVHLPPPEFANRLITLPAKISPNGREWRVNGNYERPDVDEWGNRLPTDEYRDSGNVYWNALGGSTHRAEFGKNPNDIENYGKPLPATIYEGKYNYRYKGIPHTREQMVDIINNGLAKNLDKVKKLIIKFPNGATQEINCEGMEVRYYTV
jgi:hypothetical protein